MYFSLGVLGMDLDTWRSNGVLDRQACYWEGCILLDLVYVELLMLRALDWRWW